MLRRLVAGTVFVFALCFTSSAHADSCSSRSNLVSNCGFENGFAKWNVGGKNPGDVFVYIDSSTPKSGDSDAAFGAPSAYSEGIGRNIYGPPTKLTQSLDLLTNEIYQVSFFLYTNPFGGCSVSDRGCGDGYHNYFDALLGGNELAEAEDAKTTNKYKLYTFTTSTGSVLGNDLLQFDFTNDTDYFLLDDVKVEDLGAAPTPEPSSLLLLGTGLSAVAAAAKRKFRRS